MRVFQTEAVLFFSWIDVRTNRYQLICERVALFKNKNCSQIGHIIFLAVPFNILKRAARKTIRLIRQKKHQRFLEPD